MKDNITDITGRLKRWITVVDTKGDRGVHVSVSNHGTISVKLGDEHVELSINEGVTLVSGIVRAYVEHGFGKMQELA